MNILLLLTAAGCGTFLFCLMDDASGSSFALIVTLGIGGGCSMLAVLFITIVALFAGGGNANEPTTEIQGTPTCVTEVADFWFKSIVVVTAVYVLLYLGYAMDPSSDYGPWWKVADFLLPFVALGYIDGFFMKPRRNDPRHRRKLNLHFIACFVLSPLLAAIGLFVSEWYTSTVITLIRIPFNFLGFKMGLKLREYVGKLPDIELERYLIDVIMKKGSTLLLTSSFFMFEIVSCQLEEDDPGLCENTSSAAVYLSIFLIGISIIQVVRWALPEAVRPRYNIAQLLTLDLDRKEFAQVILCCVAGTCGLFLLSSLGVAEPKSEINQRVGLLGCFLGGAILAMEILTIKKIHDRARTMSQSAASMLSEGTDSQRGLSIIHADESFQIGAGLV